jgi:hypothetical protein
MLGGAAKDAEQFDEPDAEALDEMEDLLKESAEAQGLEFKSE